MFTFALGTDVIIYILFSDFSAYIKKCSRSYDSIYFLKN